ncbi:MAG: beta-ketoacyl-ACP synthase II [Bacteroidales bacterium]|nr:beta-ketoacyl-ACP synthase II [Bacteroidales bacterium]
MNLKRVVVTGLGSLTPIGNTVPEYWNALLTGVSGANFITHFDAQLLKTRFACEVKGFDILSFMDKKESHKYDLYTQYGVAASEEAIKDSGLDLSAEDKDRIGVIWASGIGGISSFEAGCLDYAQRGGAPRFSPFFCIQMISDICAGCISIRHGLRGPNYGTVSACASSANAIADAFNLIRLNKASAFVVGGSEAAVSLCGIGGFNAMQALSTRNDSPETASRPFDKDRDGFVMGEGAGALVLEEYEHAMARGAKIYAEVMGCGLTADAYHITAPHPEGLGARVAMKQAIEEAGLQLSDISHINTHGTSTPLGDISEPKAIEALFQKHAKNISINSTKSMTGHLLGAAGAVEAIATVLAIKNDIVPPTINHFTDDPAIPDLDFTFGKARKREVNYALSNTFGFGGHNVSVAFGKFVK